MSQSPDPHAAGGHDASPSHAHHTHSADHDAPAGGADSALEQQVAQLEGIPDDQLLQVVGTYALSQQAAEMSGGLESMPSMSDIVALGRKFLENPVIQEAVCGTGGFQTEMESPTTSMVVGTIAGALGFAPGAQLPAAIVAGGWIIVRAGVRVYCKGYQPITPAAGGTPGQ